MKKETIFLRITIYVMALVMAAFCIIVIPHYLIGSNNLMPDLPIFTILLGLGLYLSAVLFFSILWQALKLLSLIDHEKAFSNVSVQALKHIKIFAYSICAIYILELLSSSLLLTEMMLPVLFSSVLYLLELHWSLLFLPASLRSYFKTPSRSNLRMT